MVGRCWRAWCVGPVCGVLCVLNHSTEIGGLKSTLVQQSQGSSWSKCRVTSQFDTKIQSVSLTFYILSFSRRFYPKRLTMYTHFTVTLMAHCTSGAIRGSVSCSRTLRQGIELATLCFLNDFFTSCTTVAPMYSICICICIVTG